MSTLGDASKELDFIAQVLRIDSKNYHTWVYRQWVLSHFGGLPSTSEMIKNNKLTKPGAGQYSHLWQGELAFIDQLLREDARNNSAWNHRFFCIFGSGWAQTNENCQEWWKIGKNYQEIIKTEIALVKEHIVTIPNNASAWNYLRG